ncbi:MAG: phosphoglycerate mutase [Flavobacterium sp.]|nr:MAG: phosphoglycerate mutase [Flavobacterium sp.]
MKLLFILLTCFFMKASFSQEATTTIYLIRHAEKADTTADTNLSEAGKERAVRWMEYLVANRIDAIYTSPYNRTRQTVKPLADGLKIKVKEYDPKVMNLFTLAEKHHNQTIVIVGHSNTIPGHINKLLGENIYPDIDEETFGNLYVITISGGKISHELIEM